MDTKIRPELSKKNQYWISRHRYYELKHFCMQYSEWKKACATLRETIIHSANMSRLPQRDLVSDPTADTAIKLERLENRIEMVEKSASQTDPVIGEYIFVGVTKGIPYDVIKARLNIPCCKEVYYDLYRRFFWLLDKARN